MTRSEPQASDSTAPPSNVDLSHDVVLSQVRQAYADAGEQRHRSKYSDSQRCLKFLTSGFTDVVGASAAVAAIQEYNRFRASKVIQKLHQIHSLDNLANFVIGRESSPVIYIETAHPEKVIDLFGGEEYNHRDSNPDELWKVDEIGGFMKEMAAGDKHELHAMCGHDSPPTTVGEWPDKGERPVVRAWWD